MTSADWCSLNLNKHARQAQKTQQTQIGHFTLRYNTVRTKQPLTAHSYRPARMPFTYRSTSPALAIELAAPPEWSYCAGDTIIGSVVRKAPIVAVKSQIYIRLLGRAKVKIVERRGQNSHVTYRSRFNFFQTNREETQFTLYQGPLHVSEDVEDRKTCDFSITVPRDPGLNLRTAEAEGGQSFLPLDAEDMKRHALPPTFTTGSGFMAGNSEGYVEYYLEAVLQYGNHSGSDSVTSTLPITVKPPPGPDPIADWGLKPKTWDNTAVSYHLVPGMETAELSFKQKSKQLFKTSSVPQLRHKVRFGVPSRLQLNHPDYIPLFLSITPDHQRTTDILHGVPQQAVVNWIKLTVISLTTVTAPGNISGSPHYNDHREKADLSLERAFSLVPEPVTLQIEQDAEPMNIGAALQLRLFRTGLYAGKTRLAPYIVVSPCFTTYNMKQTHRLRYSLRITVAGKAYDEEYDVAGAIIPAPAHGAVPDPIRSRPAAPVPTAAAGPSDANDEDPPPAFEDVVRDEKPLADIKMDTKAMITAEADKA